MSLNPNPFDRHGPRPFANCLISGVPSAVIIGTLFSGMDIAQGAKFSPKTFGTNIGFIYAYHALQCPLEAIQGRQSSSHNFYSGATLGYLGVLSRRVGVPFVPPHLLYGNPVSPAIIGGAVYGGLAFALAAFSGKPV